MQETVYKILTQIEQEFPDISFAVQDWTGQRRSFGTGEPEFTLTIHTPDAVKRTLRNSGLGFAEAFMAGEFDLDGDMQLFFKLQQASVVTNIDLSLWETVRFFVRTLFTRNSVQQVKKNVHHHYDLGNDFYRLWLDESMTYTCAYFSSPHNTLAQAQRNKHEHLCRKLRLRPGDTLVDIGCGWGAMLFYAAEHYGAICTGYTISEEQYEWLERTIHERGYQGRIFVELKDYREVDQKFDRFVSIGMAEQIGKRYIPAYFEAVKRMLKRDGSGVLHTISAPFSAATDPFMEKYIFPGGYLPTLAEMSKAMAENNLVPVDIEDLRLHYAETLSHWYARFSSQIDRVREMYGESFVRMWRLYLSGTGAAFRNGRGRLYQIAFTNELQNNLPRTRAYLYQETRPDHDALYDSWFFGKNSPAQQTFE